MVNLKNILTITPSTTILLETHLVLKSSNNRDAIKVLSQLPKLGICETESFCYPHVEK